MALVQGSAPYGSARNSLTGVRLPDHRVITTAPTQREPSPNPSRPILRIPSGNSL